MSGERNTWERMCREDGVELRRIAHVDDKALYLSVRENETPVWHVWDGSCRIYAGTWMQEAYRIWHRINLKSDSDDAFDM